MLLRASGETTGREIELGAITAGGSAGAGVRGGRELCDFAEAAVVGDEDEIQERREALRALLGDDATVDAAAVIGNFERMVRIADGTGIPLDKPVAMVSADMREEIGIDRFATAANTPPVSGPQRWVGRLMARMLPFVIRVVGRR